MVLILTREDLSIKKQRDMNKGEKNTMMAQPNRNMSIMAQKKCHGKVKGIAPYTELKQENRLL